MMMLYEIAFEFLFSWIRNSNRRAFPFSKHTHTKIHSDWMWTLAFNFWIFGSNGQRREKKLNCNRSINIVRKCLFSIDLCISKSEKYYEKKKNQYYIHSVSSIGSAHGLQNPNKFYKKRKNEEKKKSKLQYNQ